MPMSTSRYLARSTVLLWALITLGPSLAAENIADWWPDPALVGTTVPAAIWPASQSPDELQIPAASERVAQFLKSPICNWPNDPVVSLMTFRFNTREIVEVAKFFRVDQPFDDRSDPLIERIRTHYHLGNPAIVQVDDHTTMLAWRTEQPRQALILKVERPGVASDIPGGYNLSLTIDDTTYGFPGQGRILRALGMLAEP